ncbi:retrovirus-related pol polyprotein from transposon TNT 1-94 [Tanacetum coccineum]
MSSMQEDISVAVLIPARPTMLDRTDFESLATKVYVMYCSGKVQQVQVYNGTSTHHSIHYTDAKDIWENVKMILEGSELTKDDRESQLYDEFEHFYQNKGETIQGYYVRFTKLINDMRNIKLTMPWMQLTQSFNEVHANENRIMMERFIQPNNDPLALRKVGAQNRGGMINPGQAKPIKCYNCNGLGHIAQWNVPKAKGLQESNFFMDMMLLMHARIGVKRMDLALNVDHIFEADECDAFDSDVVEDVPLHRPYHMDESDSNIIPYASVCGRQRRTCLYNVMQLCTNDALMSMLDEIHETELEKVKQHYKELYDSIKITRAHTSEKTSTMLNEIESLKAQLRSKESCFTSDYVKPKVLAPGMYAIDVKPIPHPLKNNRSAHLNYISHLKESVETVREIVEEARVVKPLDNALNYACQYTKLSQELLEYVIGTCPKSFNERDNKAPSTPVTRKKQVTFSDKPGTSSSNTQKHKVHQRVQQTNIPVIPSTGVNDSTEASGSKPRSNTKKNRILPAKKENKKEVEVRLRTNKSVWTKVNRVDSSISSKRVVINSNSESVCKTCNKCVNSASHGMCVVNILNSVNATSTVKTVLNKGKQIWKPKGRLSDNSLYKTKRVWKATGKLFADIGYQWRPTGKKLTLGKLDCGSQWRPTGKKFALGEMCHLTKLSVKCCSKHMTGNRSKLMNFVEKFIGSVRFGNDHLGAIMGYGDYVMGDSVISRVYYVEGLGHNLFSIGQFCDSDLEVAFRKHTCFVRDIKGTYILKGSRSTNLYTISIDEMMKSSLICLLSKASKSKSWLWHRRLNHLNFGTINDLARKDLVRGLPRLKFEKDHLCSACQLGKSKKFSHQPKSENTNMEVLHTLHMDLCGPMRVQSIKGKKYILVIVDDYSRFTWVKFLRSKDETLEFVTNFLKQIQVGLNKTVRFIRTDNGTEFVNQVMSEYYEGVGIFHQTSIPRTPQQNGIVERRNRTLVEAARTMMIFSKAPMFLWAEAVATACYTQNRSLIHTRHNKTPYELVHDKKPDLTFFRVFGALCYPTNDSENLGKFQAKADIGIFVGYAPSRKGYRIYNKRTRRLMETIHVTFDVMIRTMDSYAPSTKSIMSSSTSASSSPFYKVLQPWSQLSKTPQLLKLTLHPSVNLLQENLFATEDGPKITLLITSLAIPLILYLQKTISIRCFVVCFPYDCPKSRTQELQMAVIEDAGFQSLQDETQRMCRLEYRELVLAQIYGLWLSLQVDLQSELDEYGDLHGLEAIEYSWPMLQPRYDHLQMDVKTAFTEMEIFKEEVFSNPCLEREKKLRNQSLELCNASAAVPFSDGDGDEIPSSVNVKLIIRMLRHDYIVMKIYKGVKFRKLCYIFSSQSAQDGNKLLDDERLSLADDLKKAL